MAANYVLLEKITVGAAGAASVTFQNIPQTGYTDLKIVMSARTNASGAYENVIVKPNGATTNLSDKTLYTINGTSAASAGDPTQLIIGQAATASETVNVFGNSECYIPNYTSSNYKSFSSDGVNENNATAATLMMIAGLWQSTAAITSLVIAPSIGSSFTQYSTFSLYGLAAVGATPVIDPKATGGDIIQTDGTYWYHAFLSSGTFTPKVGLTCDVLVVAGGGGGASAGGGAGGVLGFASQNLPSGTAQTVTLGAGGNSGTGSLSGSAATQGTASSFGSLTATVGGGIGSRTGNAGDTSGGSGGSGGGGGSSAGTLITGGAGTSGQGYAGGNNAPTSTSSSPYSSGGGGGAGGVGGQGNGGSISGNGGAGVNTYTNATWLSSALTVTGLGVSGYIAGGGGGGLYVAGGTVGIGSAGGGNGGSGVAGTNAIPNTGGGGGGAGGSANGGAGGSGLVIVRYTVA